MEIHREAIVHMQFVGKVNLSGKVTQKVSATGAKMHSILN